MASDKKTQSVPVIAPDGQAYMIPVDELSQAFLHGGKPAIRMAAPDGDQYWIPADQAEEGMQHGGHIVQNDGTAYSEETEPLVVGHNSAGQPIWGNYTDLPASQRFEHAMASVLRGAAKGAFDANPTEQEKAEGLTSPFDFWMRPFERVVEGQAQEGEQAANLLKHKEYMRGVAHALASVIPMFGPMASQFAEDYYGRLAKGDVAGAMGSLGGNAGTLAAMEYLPKAFRAGVDLAKSVPARVAEFQAPAEMLEKAPAPGVMSPKERWEAANGMGVNLDRAQATGGANVPGTAKRVTEESLAGRGVFERNNAANLDALHQHAHDMQEEAGPAMGREEFGARTQQALQRHRSDVTDESGQRAEARDLLNRIDKHEMDGQEFGAAAQQALHEHHDATYQKASDLLTGALERKGTLAGIGDVEQTANRIFDENQPYYEENPWAMKVPGVRQAWDIVRALRSREEILPSKADTGLVDRSGKPLQKDVAGKKFGPRELSPAHIAKMRSDLWNLYQSPEVVGSQAEGWLKQLVASLDDSITDPANEKGMTPGEIQKFRAGNSLWKRMKSMYDDPQSPFFSILRSPEPKTVAGTLEKLKPTAAQQFREAMADTGRQDLVRQQQRQIVSHMLDPNENGQADLGGLASRFEKLPKEQARELLDEKHLNALGSLAKRTQETTPYDTFPHLKQIVEAPDGMAASRVMFSDNGALRLTPGEVQHISAADPDLIPMLRRQTMERLMDPAGNGAPDLRNFSSRWTRAQKEPASAVLTPEQMENLDNLAEVGRTVQTASNPSGTARTLQPANEAGSLVKGVVPAVGAVLGGMHGGFEGAGAGAAVGSVADTLARGAVARRLVNPDATAAIMEHEAPTTVAETVKSAAETPGLVSSMLKPIENPAKAVSGAVGMAGAASAAPSTKDQFAAATQKRTAPPADDAREGVSTPPNGGQITDVGKAEPNEVHNPAQAAAELQALQGKQNAQPAATGTSAGPKQNGAAPASHGGTQPADIVTGTTAGGASPQAKVEPPPGATHEVLGENGETLGHVVDGEYVPLDASAA